MVSRSYVMGRGDVVGHRRLTGSGRGSDRGLDSVCRGRAFGLLGCDLESLRRGCGSRSCHD